MLIKKLRALADCDKIGLAVCLSDHLSFQVSLRAILRSLPAKLEVLVVVRAADRSTVL